MKWLIAGKSDISNRRLNDRKKRGFNQIELFIDENTKFKQYKTFQEILKNNGIEVCSVHTPHYLTTATNRKLTCAVGAYDDWQKEQSLALIRETIKFANKIIPEHSKSRVVVVHPATNILLKTINLLIGKQKGLDRDSALNDLKTGLYSRIETDLRSLLDVAKKENIILCLENMPVIHPFNWDNDWSQVYLTCRFTEKMKTLIEKINSPNLLIAVDLAHLITVKNSFNFDPDLINHSFFITKEKQKKYHSFSISDYLKELDHTIGLVHLSYAKGIGEVYENHGLPWPNENKNELKSIMQTLKSLDFSGAIIVEINEPNLDYAVGSEITLSLLKNIIEDNSWDLL